MATNVTASTKATQEFEIPVSWQVSDVVKVKANSLQEAFDYVKEHADEIPCGDEPEYIDGSYEISADDYEGCLAYQETSDVVCMQFVCNDLTEYTDSMLFDSIGDGGEDGIAEGTFAYNGKTLVINLDVRGEVSVTYKEETYYKPSEFPEELKERIRKNPNEWMFMENDEDGDICVNMNNWFEYTWDSAEGEVCEDDLSISTKEEVLESMMYIARQYFGLDSDEDEWED